MVNINNNTAPDYGDFLTQNERLLTTDLQKDALRRILATSTEINNRIRSDFGAAHELITGNKTVFTDAEERILRKATESISQRELALPDRITCPGLQVTSFMGMQTLDVTLNIPKANIDWSQPEDALRHEIENRVNSAAGLASLAETVPAGAFLSPNQAQQLANVLIERMRPYRLQASLAGEGVNPLNIQAALQFAGTFTEEELNHILRPNLQMDQVERDEARAHLSEWVNELERIPDIDPGDEGFDQLPNARDELRRDRRKLQSGVGVFKTRPLAGQPVPTLSVVDADRRRECERLLLIEEDRLNNLQNHYNQIQTRLEAIGRNARETELNSVTLEKYLDMTVNPPTLRDRRFLTTTFRPSLVAQALRKELGNFEHPHVDYTSLTGTDAVLAIYRAYLKKRHPETSDYVTDRVANMLFAENVIDREMIENNRKILRNVMRKGVRSGLGGYIDSLQGLFVGNSAEFVNNLAQASGLPENEGQWGDRDLLPNLTQMYFALRECIRQGHLGANEVTNDTAKKFEYVGQLLARFSYTRTLSQLLGVQAGSSANTAESQDASSASSAILNQKIGAATLFNMPLSELPQEYQDSIKATVEKAVSQTAWKRRAVGRAFNWLTFGGLGLGWSGIQKGWGAANETKNIVLSPITTLGEAAEGTANAMGRFAKWFFGKQQAQTGGAAGH